MTKVRFTDIPNTEYSIEIAELEKKALYRLYSLLLNGMVSAHSKL
jgi:hypothetical protein